MALVLLNGVAVVAAFPSETSFVNDANKIVIGGVSYWHSDGQILVHDFGNGVNDGILTDPPFNDYSWDGTTFGLSAAGIARRNAKAPVPSSVTPAQARVALVNAGLFSAVDAAVNATGVNGATWQWWHYALSVQRNSPTLDALAAGLGLTSDQVDDLFRAASILEA